jgi:hypothetical protein
VLQIEDHWDEPNPYYHEPGDTIAHMNLDYWEEQIRATLVTAAHLAVPLDESGFSLSAAPAMRAIAAGGVATYTIGVEPVGGFTTSVDLHAASPSPDLALNLVPGAVDPPCQATLTLTDTRTGTMLPSQWYTVPITATGGGITHTTSVSLFIEGVEELGFTLSAMPAMRAIAAGGVATYTIGVRPVGGFTASVDLHATSPSPDLALDLVPDAVAPPGQATLTLTDTRTGTMLPRQRYTVPVTGTGGGIAQMTSVRLLITGVPVYMPVVLRSHE